MIFLHTRGRWRALIFYTADKIKIHKSNLPLRPIVNRNTSPIIALEKYVNELLKPLIKGNYSVKNSIQIIDQISNIQLNKTDKFFSIDVVALYPSIPYDELIDVILSLCEPIPILHMHKLFIEAALKLIKESNTFQIGGKIYRN